MYYELDLRFPDAEHVGVRFDGMGSTGLLPFTAPLTGKDYADIRWYVETYGAYSLGEPDDAEAERITTKLPELGKALFQSVFQHPAAERLFNAFQNQKQQNRLLTINTGNPAILALPWELLHDSQMYLFQQSINLRRRLDGTQFIQPFASKPRLHLLFVISRPQDAGFIDPRADAKPVLDALDEYAKGCISTEFLHPATLQALQERLEDTSKPAVNILHFDGHGSFDEDSQSGSLLFETSTRINYNAVSADRLGPMLRLHNIPLVILSACQSAALGEEPLGSVATGLLAQGIPAVLAMTHKVLVKTTETFFGAFYQTLGEGNPLGLAVKQARDYLDNHPDKQQVRRGQDWLPLKLHDWFVPALYQSGEDQLLLEPAPTVPPFEKGGLGGIFIGPQKTNLPTQPQAGFFGRTLELWQIERGFALKTRRITITGFGGQGKTALAQEAGHWLLRTGQFQAVVFVNYASLQTLDTVAIALNTLGEVLSQSFPNSFDAIEALKKTPTLLILDNLESLQPEPLKELLDSAVEWSQIGGSRVLLTTRSPDFQHAAYPVAGGLDYLRVPLKGLGSREYPDDALEWFGELQKRPPTPELPAPTREELVGLFDKVGFHPLSIHILAVQLKTRSIAELGERLDLLLVEIGQNKNDDMPLGLEASLELSVDQLDAEARALLPRLGVFHGGAFESRLLEITEMGTNCWVELRQKLEVAALISVEIVPDVTVPFLRFHPTLAPLLWLKLDHSVRLQLSNAHLTRYCILARYLYHRDSQAPHGTRAIAYLELPNLLYAARAAFQYSIPEAVELSYNLNLFLSIFGLRLEQEKLALQATKEAESQGSLAWFQVQSNLGELLLDLGKVNEAAIKFQMILKDMDETSSNERAITIARLGRCLMLGGQPDQAAQLQNQALAMLDSLKSNDNTKRLRGNCFLELGTAFQYLGRYKQAQRAYLSSLAIFQELEDIQRQASVLGQLGSLAWLEGRFEEAIQNHKIALHLFQALQEPAMETISWHWLGIVYQQIQQWNEAEHCYRQSARINEMLGNKSGAAGTWNNLAVLNMMAGKPEAAEAWFLKVITVHRENNDPMQLAIGLNNLAEHLRTQPDRLAEAWHLAEESLTISQTLDPCAVQIWRTYNILAQIAEQQAETCVQSTEWLGATRKYRHLSQTTYRAFPGNKMLLLQHASLILTVCAACTALKPKFWLNSFSHVFSARLSAQAAATMDEYQSDLREGGPEWIRLADALDCLRSGERNPEILLEKLGFGEALILETILLGIADPTSLDWLRQKPGTEDAEP